MQSANEIKHLTNEVAMLKREVKHLRSLLIGVAGEDREGRYRPTFVKELLAASEEEPNHRYTGSGSLVKQLADLR